jgi:MEDS: MEthanogen/methylotroph, DcmR Sensory domain
MRAETGWVTNWVTISAFVPGLRQTSLDGPAGQGEYAASRPRIVRVAGPVEPYRGLGLPDHVCWVYEDPVDAHARLAEFFTDGLQLGQRAGYVSLGGVEELRDQLAGLDDLDGLVPVVFRSPPLARRIAGLGHLFSDIGVV